MGMIKRTKDSMGRPTCRGCGIHIGGRAAYCPRCGLDAVRASKSLWEAKRNRPTATKRQRKAILPAWS
jgi:predicted amidophosphoribosyltransferase